jgi:hypothetical protein
VALSSAIVHTRHAWHRAHGGRPFDFAGWSMPVQSTSIIEEHQAIRYRIETNRSHRVCYASNRTKVLAQFGTHAHWTWERRDAVAPQRLEERSGGAATG